MLNKSGESRYACCSWFWRESFELFTIKYDVSCGFVINGVYYVEMCSLYINFDEHFLSWMDVVDYILI